MPLLQKINKNHCRIFSGEPSVAVKTNRHACMHAKVPLLSQMQSSKELLCWDQGFSVLYHPLPGKEHALAELLANKLQFSRANPRVAHEPTFHTHPCTPSFSTTAQSFQRMGAAASYLSQGHLRQTGAEEEGETFVSRAHEPGSPTDLLFPHPI